MVLFLRLPPMPCQRHLNAFATPMGKSGMPRVANHFLRACKQVWSPSQWRDMVVSATTVIKKGADMDAAQVHHTRASISLTGELLVSF